MTRRPKVWEPREGTSGGEEMPEWSVRWGPSVQFATHVGPQFAALAVRAPHAFAAHQQVKGAPAFGSCRVRRVE